MDENTKKKAALIIALGAPSTKKGDTSDDGDEEGSLYDAGLEDAMRDFLRASGKNDAKGMAEAFADAHRICADRE